MTVGKSGEVKMNCGGVSDLTVTAVWEERMDTSAKASAIAVTGLTVTAKETGRPSAITVISRSYAFMMTQEVLRRLPPILRATWIIPMITSFCTMI